MTVTERLRLLQRCREFYQDQKRQARARGRCVAYRLEDLHGLVEKHLPEAPCPYCHRPLTPARMALACRTPAGRGGRFTFRNVEVSCSDCLAVRGALDGPEFRELLLLVRTWPKPVQNEFLARLRAASQGPPPVLPEPGSLEWFTGSAEAHAPPDLRLAPRPAPRPEAGGTPCSA